MLGEEEKRQPATLKAYMISLRLFFKFVIARHEEIRKLEEFNDSDILLVNSALARLETWPKALTDAMNKRKADIRLRDVEEKLIADDYETFFNSARAKEIKKMYADIKKQENPTVSVNDFAAMRDYLLLRVLVASGQRCGAASNLTIYEFLNGTWTDNNRIYVSRKYAPRHLSVSKFHFLHSVTINYHITQEILIIFTHYKEHTPNSTNFHTVPRRNNQQIFSRKHMSHMYNLYKWEQK